MMTIAIHSGIAPQLQRRAWIALMLVLFFGLLSLAAVREVREDCRSEPQYLMRNSGGYVGRNSGGRIRLEQDRQQCQLVAGDVRVPLLAWAKEIFKRVL
jgi:hypothetical protein